MRFGEATAPLDNNNNSNAMGQPSPMFSDDMGPATPLVLDTLESMNMNDKSNFNDTNNNNNNNSIHTNNNNNNSEEVKMLREVISQMRAEMEEMMKSPPPTAAQGLAGLNPTSSSTTTNNNKSILALEQQLDHSRQYVVVLQNSNDLDGNEEVALLRRHVSELNDTINSLRIETVRLENEKMVIGTGNGSGTDEGNVAGDLAQSKVKEVSDMTVT